MHLSEHRNTGINLSNHLSPLRTIVLFIVLAVGFVANAEERTLLIINSYTENAPWARTMFHPISTHISSIDNVHCEVMHLNNILVTDSASYDKASSHIFSKYDSVKNRPDYVVFIGYLAFTLRDQIKEKWGNDVPMLLISRTELYCDRLNSFSGYEYGKPEERPLTELRKDYNFTAVFDKDYYKENINLMDRLIVNMDTLVFISDAMPLNRTLDHKISRYLKSNYPNVSYKWLTTNEEYSSVLFHYFTEKHESTGLLLGSWNIVSYDTQGNRMPGMGEILNMYASATPIFALRQSYMDYGAVGGVYANQEDVNRSIVSVIDDMLAGKSMRDIPFQYNDDVVNPVLNFELIENYRLNADNCPDGTEFLHRPKTFWENHLWHTIAILLIFALIILLLVTRSHSQASKIKTLRRSQDFVAYMPVPFSKADILFNDKGEVYDIEYTLHNESFEELIKENSRPGLPTKIFPFEFIAEQTKKLLETGEPVHFSYHFKDTDKYYDFLLCNVALAGKPKKGANTIKEVDLFATDITERLRLENELKKITSRFDKTITISGLLPWIWYIKEDRLVFDAYSLTKRINRDLDNPTLAHQSKITVQEYLALVPDEDKHVLIKIREDLREGRIKEFKERYRLKVAKNGKDVYEWMDARGVVTEYDKEDGKPLVMVGSVYIITEFIEEA